MLAFVSDSCFRAMALCMVMALAPLSAAQLGVRVGAMSGASRKSPHSGFSEKVGLYHSFSTHLINADYGFLSP